eukprot:COSAG01_NODE_11077_length_2012_cov_1.479352_3_plen_136_part_00
MCARRMLFCQGEGHEAVVQALLANGATPSAQNTAGWTPLHRAALWGQLGTAQLLVQGAAHIESICCRALLLDAAAYPVLMCHELHNRPIWLLVRLRDGVRVLPCTRGTRGVCWWAVRAGYGVQAVRTSRRSRCTA